MAGKNMGMIMPGWFDITQLGLDKWNRDDDFEGIMMSVQLLHCLIQEQIGKGIPNERIIVGGFSQGGAVALLVRSFVGSYVWQR
jgi:lysophospholipase-2